MSKDNQKKVKLSKLIKRGIIVVNVCEYCNGSGVIHGHGAFGEPESDICSRCSGTGKIIKLGENCEANR